MEMDRRPVAARRSANEAPPMATGVVPECDVTSLVRQEALRRPVAARRLGLLQTVPSGIGATVRANALALSFADTAAGAMERARRPRAAGRVASPAHPEQRVAGFAVVPSVPLADTAYARMEETRRPHAAAKAKRLRLTLHSQHAEESKDAEAERVFASWRKGSGVSFPAPADLGTADAHELETLKRNASTTRLVPETDPFAALERMLETHLQAPLAHSPPKSGATSRGGSARGGGAYASTFLHTSRSSSGLRRGSSNHGASNYLDREEALERRASHENSAVSRRVRCSLENSDVVCRVNDCDEVIEHFARDSLDAKIAALAETLENERLSAQPSASR
jgi:hypothetical protein